MAPAGRPRPLTGRRVSRGWVLLRYSDANGDGWTDVIDRLTMYPDVRAAGSSGF
jgi:hypothetical protein